VEIAPNVTNFRRRQLKDSCRFKKTIQLLLLCTQQLRNKERNLKKKWTRKQEKKKKKRPVHKK
jgi:hypothetical protein